MRRCLPSTTVRCGTSGAARGVEVDTPGDAFFVAFARASDAVAAAADAQVALAAGPVRVRMGLHTGEPLSDDEGYVGFDVHRAARIAAAGHGGQVLLSQATADLAGAEVRDLGLHRLKDLSAPERLFQLGTEVFPPLKTLHETNLPVPATPFLGREQEIEELAALMRRADVRLVTLTGPGGSGKTRLALQAAAAAADDYDHGVWWVPLASLADPSTRRDRRRSGARLEGHACRRRCGDKRLLLVLDNFEHLLDAAAGVAETIGSCPQLTVLVTSREPLHVDGEWEIAVDPLRDREAVELFVQRAAGRQLGLRRERRGRRDLPPARLPAARDRARGGTGEGAFTGGPARTARAAASSARRRLPVGARAAANAAGDDRLEPRPADAGGAGLFARLAVFAGGCTLEAAEAICGADVDAIASLVDKSLLRRTGDRYWMLETIREFAAERLDELADAPSLRDRHAAWYVELGERARPELRAREARDVARAARRRAREPPGGARAPARERDADGALRLAGAIWPYWQTRGHWTEGRRYLAAAVALGGDLEPERLVNSLWGGIDPRPCGRATSTKVSSWRHASSRSRRPRRNRSTSMRWRSTCLRSSRPDGVIVTGRWRCSRSRSRSAVAGATLVLSIALNNLGDLLMGEGEYERAVELFEESLAIGEARGDLDRRARAYTTRLGNARPRRPRPCARLLPPRPRGGDRDRAGRGSALGAVRPCRWKPRPAKPASELVCSADEGTEVASRCCLRGGRGRRAANAG